MEKNSCNTSAIYGFSLKYVALFFLVFQNAAVVFVLRYSKIVTSDEKEEKYLNTSAVVSSEVLKFVFSIILVFYEKKCRFRSTANFLINEIIKKPKEMLHIGVPAILYVLQNNLIFISLSNLSGAVHQVTYQLKILTTALWSVIILRKSLPLYKWLSLLLLTVGVALIILPPKEASKSKQLEVIQNLTNSNDQKNVSNVFIGFCAVLSACATSGLAGVYLEKILKNTKKTSVWVANIQLSIHGLIFGLMAAFVHDGEKIQMKGFFQGYTFTTHLLIFLQAFGGIAVAAVLKYADNILKCFATAASLILSCLASYYILGDFIPTKYFVGGTAAVIISTYMYGTETVWHQSILKKMNLLKLFLMSRWENFKIIQREDKKKNSN